MPDRLKEKENGDFQYTVLYTSTHLPPSYIDVDIPADKDSMTADTSHMHYSNARAVGELLEEKGYDVDYPDPPLEIRAYRRVSEWLSKLFG